MTAERNPGSGRGVRPGRPFPGLDIGVRFCRDDRLPFRLPILRICDSYDDVVDEVQVTVVHEVAHYFGIDDDRLHELGWG